MSVGQHRNGAGELVGSPADAHSWPGTAQPDPAGTAPGQSRDAYQCLPARLSLRFQHPHQDASQSQELPNQLQQTLSKGTQSLWPALTRSRLLPGR